MAIPRPASTRTLIAFVPSLTIGEGRSSRSASCEPVLVAFNAFSMKAG